MNKDNMFNIFNIFNKETQKVLIKSRQLAQKMKVPTGTDHLLLALLSTPDTLSQKILKDHMVATQKVKFVIKVDSLAEKNSKSDMTKEFQNILEIAADSTMHNKKEKVAPEDLLNAIIRSKHCAANKILVRLGINLDQLEYDLYTYDKQSKKVDEKEKYISNLFGPQDNQMFNSEQPHDFDPQIFFTQPGAQFQKQKKAQSPLKQYGIDLTQKAQNKELDPVIGREKEIDRIIQILCRRQKNNPVLVGEPGVGKTAIVEGLAQRIQSSKVPLKLLGKKIINIDLAMTISGTMYRGQFEQRVKQIISQAQKDDNIILFIDEIHTIIGTGSAEGSMDVANIIKPALAKGEIRLIGATTFEEYRKHIEKDSALERRLQKIIVQETNINQTINIANKIRPILEKFHNVRIKDEAIQTAVKLSSRYIFDRFQPDKTIDLLDEAAAATNLKIDNTHKTKLEKINEQLSKTLTKKEKSINEEDFAKAAYLRSKELQLKQEKVKLTKLEVKNASIQTITSYDVAKIVSSWTNIPIDNLVQDDYTKIKYLEKRISKHIIGQDKAIKEISLAIKKTKTQLSDPNRPLGTFMFLGPTGVGKTELVKVLTKTLFGTTKKLIKIDMSEFMEKHNVSRLVGAPPGYVGFNEAGKLTESVRNNPYSVVLLDEIEKAHPETFNILLQIMEDGYLTDAKGRKVNFRNTIIIMTSNIGIGKLNQQAAIGFTTKTKKEKYKNLSKKITQSLTQNFKPEFINRIDSIIIFKPLDKKSIQSITELQIKKISTRLRKNHIDFDIDKKAVKLISEKSYKPEFGARQIRRNIDKLISQKIAQLIVEKEKIKSVLVKTNKNKIVFDIK